MTPTSRPAADEPDEDLVRRVRAGDEAAARLLFERHLPALRAKARARLPSALRGKVAESDVIQDAWLAAFLDLGKFDDRGDGSFGKWLRGILDHKVVDEVRRQFDVGKRDARRQVRLETRAATIGPASRQPSPSGEAMAAEERARLREVVAGMPGDYKTVIALVHEEGLSLVDAGTRMGRSADAVRKLYGRAVARLADGLDGPEDTES